MAIDLLSSRAGLIAGAQSLIKKQTVVVLFVSSALIHAPTQLRLIPGEIGKNGAFFCTTINWWHFTQSYLLLPDCVCAIYSFPTLPITGMSTDPQVSAPQCTIPDAKSAVTIPRTGTQTHGDTVKKEKKTYVISFGNTILLCYKSATKATCKEQCFLFACLFCF